MPDDYIRKQTLTNAERFTYPKLQEYEEIILSAAEKISAIQEKLYNEILEKLRENTEKLKQTGKNSSSPMMYCLTTRKTAS